MVQSYKWLKDIERKRALTGEIEEFSVISVTEEVKVRRRVITAVHTYWVPKGADLRDDNNYLEPIDNPDYNLQLDFGEYRKRFGVLTPDQIKEIRQGYHLSLRQYALVLGISYSTLSEIENGLVLQSDEQESLFRMSESSQAFTRLVQSKVAVVPERQYQSIRQKLVL